GGVAVGGHSGGAGGWDRGIGAWLVLDDYGLAPDLAQALGDHAGEDVGGSARRERHHESDRPTGIGLGVILRGSRQYREQRRHERDRIELHGVPHNSNCPQSNLMPLSLITLSQRSASLRMKAANSSGVLVTG